MALSQWTELANRYGARFSVPPGLILSIIDFESGGDPNKVSDDPNSKATGLMQITGKPLRGYNERHGLSLTRNDLFDPETNVRIGTELLKRISLAYQKFNSLKPQWGNPTYVGLIVYGWNSGYAQKGGVGEILTRFQASGIDKSRWSIKMVHQFAKQHPQRFEYLSQRGTGWTQRVTDRFLGIEKNARKRVAKTEDGDKDWSTGKKVLVYGSVGAGILTAGYFILSKSDVQESATGLLASAGNAPPIIIINKK